MHEAEIMKLLGGSKRVHELVAPWDKRFRGHTDHELEDGTLLEIKSVTWKLFARMQTNQKPRWKDRSQVQAYMRYGGFPHGILLYVPRDIPPWVWDGKDSTVKPFWCVGVKRNEKWMDELDERARRVLECMDRGEPPACECGHCKLKGET